MAESIYFPEEIAMKPYHCTMILAAALFAVSVAPASAEELLPQSTGMNGTLETLIDARMTDVLRRDIAIPEARTPELQDFDAPSLADIVDIELPACDCVSANY
jgi:hypothetical protein